MTNKILASLLAIINTLPPLLAAATLIFIAHMHFEAQVWSHLDVDPSCLNPSCLDLYSRLSSRAVTMLEARGDTLIVLLLVVFGVAITTAPLRGKPNGDKAPSPEN